MKYTDGKNIMVYAQSADGAPVGAALETVSKAAELAKQAGARRCIPLKVSGPFHTRLMAPAGDALRRRHRSS